MTEINNISERIVLTGIDEKGGEANLSELAELTRTAGGQVCASLLQRREAAHPAHYLGKGKLEELKALVLAEDADCVVCDDELSPAQIRNMAEKLEIKVIDRTMLILDIFALHAGSAEGKAQVELAQLKYRLSRLTGLGKAMSRLGGGIGTRGPGETKLESDRRHIRERISRLNDELKEIAKRRGVLRQQRERSNIPQVSLVGYTNAGKSTLMNLLSGAGVLVENKLFATLDTTTRKVSLNGEEILLSDTVGFIRKLPAHLIDAFRSTLAELRYADILIHVVDTSNPDYPAQMDVVYATLSELQCGATPVITAFNKIDMLSGSTLPPHDPRAKKTARISAVSGLGQDELMSDILEVLKSFRKKLSVLLPYTEGWLIQYAHNSCTVLSEEHTLDGVLMELYGDAEAEGRMLGFSVEKQGNQF